MSAPEKAAGTAPQFKSSHDRLIGIISEMVAPLGYEVVHLEVQAGRQNILRLFIDFTASAPANAGNIGIEDCVKVTRLLDEPLDKLPELDALFGGAAYELEVSSPGVDRPLRTERDFERFAGRDVRIHVFRPLTGKELDNDAYQLRNPKQKNFIGRLIELRGNSVRLGISPGGEKPMKKGKVSTGASPAKNSVEEVSIPLPLISKANLEPDFDDLEPGKRQSGERR